MAASYPTGVKVWSKTDPGFEYPEDLKTIVFARHVVTLYDEVTAVESQLGAGGVVTSTWSGTFDSDTTGWVTLKNRLLNIEAGVKAAYDGRVKTAGGSAISTSSSTVGLSITTAGTGNLLEIRDTSNAIVNKFDKDGSFYGVIDGGTA
jgi:hypothetical protein